jgi:AbrB family looped-hinge helix DNA binding protein
MKTAIDKAGRIVVPAPIRRRLRLRAGTKLDIVVEGDTVRLYRSVSGPRIVRVGKRLVATPTATDLPEVDVAELVEAERDRSPW